jgi:mannan endo-1,4-beta-mannosidase
MNRLILKLLVAIVFCTATTWNGYGQKLLKPSDDKLTPPARYLYDQMRLLYNTGIMFGHQDDLAYGLGWKNEPGRSDVKSVTGSYPAVFGWDLGHIELDSANNLDSVPFNRIKLYIKRAYQFGGINTISWHLNNPVNGKSAWDTSENIVSQIIPGGKYHQKYISYLNKVAAFLNDLRGPHHELIPILFRPFHEQTGSWFWWGENHCSAADYKALWRFTVNYLRNTKKLHNLLFVFSSSKFNSAKHYLKRYPGDGYVDVMGFDTYSKPQEYDYVQTVDKQLFDLQKIAQRYHKIAALTETGNITIPQANWWTNTLLPMLLKYRLSYVLVWRNARLSHYYAPFPGQISEADFKLFYKNKKIIFLDRLKSIHPYQKTKP